MTPRDEIEEIEAGDYFDRETFDAVPLEGERAAFVSGWLARSALSRPAPATEAKCETLPSACPSCDSDDPGWRRRLEWPDGDEGNRDGLKCEDDWHDAGASLPTPRAGASEGEVIERCAKRAEDCACPHARDDKSSRYGFCGHARCGHFHEAADAIRALRPTPPPAEGVEAKRREFAASGSAWARHQFECPGAAFEGPGQEWYAENDALRIKAIHDHDALLAAERAERGGTNEGGKTDVR